MSTKQENSISDEWITQKAKLAFLAFASECEAHKKHEIGDDDNALSTDALWGRTRILEEIIHSLNEAIEGPTSHNTIEERRAAELSEVS